MLLPRGILVLPLALAAPLPAQTLADSGAFVVRLGRDTLAVERYTRSPAELRSDIVLRVPDARRVRYVATLHGGAVSALDLAIEPLGDSGRPARGVMRFRGDTAVVDLTLHDGTRHVRVPARVGAVPLAAFSHALIEQ
ncbi:MAG TPA: hypothetical protein VFZ26_09055, partial [Gemmatimonadales bacterium]